MKIYAHRGYSGKYPENTMTAFKKAEETGCDGIELDIQMTKDGEIVVIHDEEISRLTNGTGYVKDYTLKELQSFHMKADEKERIPSFKEYCKWVKDTELVTNVEFKTGKIYYPEIEKKAIKIIKKYKLQKRVMFSSFNPLSLIKAKKIAPKIKCGLLTENHILNAGSLCAVSGFEYYHPDLKFMTAEYVEECFENGVQLNIWTPNTKEEIEQLKNWGVEGAITDFPEIEL